MTVRFQKMGGTGLIAEAQLLIFMWCRIDIGAHHASFCLGVHRGVISGRPPKDHSGCRADLTSEDITQAYLGAVATGSPDALSLPNDSTSVGFLDFVYPSCWPCGVVACSLVSQKIFWLGGSRSRQIAPAVNLNGAGVRLAYTLKADEMAQNYRRACNISRRRST
jgi:hypothetical protein